MSIAAPGSELETKWVRLAQAGDQQAFAQLILIYWEGVTGMVYRMCGDTNLAEDAAQDTFLRAWQNLRSYEPRTTLRSWLYRIAANRAIDLLRREKPAADIGQIDPPDDAALPETRAILNERQAKVQAAVLALPIASRSVLILREYEGLSYKEISETLDIPLGTVMSRLNFARLKLAAALQDELEDA